METRRQGSKAGRDGAGGGGGKATIRRRRGSGKATVRRRRGKYNGGPAAGRVETRERMAQGRRAEGGGQRGLLEGRRAERAAGRAEGEESCWKGGEAEMERWMAKRAAGRAEGGGRRGFNGAPDGIPATGAALPRWREGSERHDKDTGNPN